MGTRLNFFISYNKADSQWATWIAWQLHEAKYTVQIQSWDFLPGNNFVLEMQRAAEEAERTIIVLSPEFLASRFVQPEWAAAFAQDPTGAKRSLVPVRFREKARLIAPYANPTWFTHGATAKTFTQVENLARKIRRELEG